jgi:hypothetical protein
MTCVPIKAAPTALNEAMHADFQQRTNGREYLRIPISYLLKLALADAVGEPSVHATVQEIGHSAMNHFLSDNTSPETFSFHPVPWTSNPARERVFPGRHPCDSCSRNC